MSTALPQRFCTRNSAPCVSAPAAVRLVATRTAGDRPVVVLVADIGDMGPAGRRSHALQVLAAVAERFPDTTVDVQLLDEGNTPLLIVSQQGGAL